MINPIPEWAHSSTSKEIAMPTATRAPPKRCEDEFILLVHIEKLV